MYWDKLECSKDFRNTSIVWILYIRRSFLPGISGDTRRNQVTKRFGNASTSFLTTTTGRQLNNEATNDKKLEG